MPLHSEGPHVAVVTGADQPIGRAVAYQMITRGLHVIACSATGADGLDCEGFHFEVEDRCSVEELAGLVQRREPRILVNAATLSISKRFVDVTLEELRRAHAVNFLAPTRLSQAAVPGMKQRRCGHIVNITSIWGDVIRPDVSVLAATKAALASATAALAHECASASVRVNSVAVGPIEEDGFDDLRAKMPMGRFVKASEVADIVLWMTAADSSAVTGQNVVADGGLSRFC